MNEIVVFINAAPAADGWAQIAPFGDFPGIASKPADAGKLERFRAIQRIDKAAATELANSVSALRGPLPWTVGIPIFEGHPDSPAVGARWARKEPIGAISEVAVREDGIYGRPTFFNTGAELLNGSAPMGFSGRWLGEPITDAASPTPVFRPTRLLSVGLTTNPNLPVEMLNECEQAGEEAKTMNKEKILAWLKGQGVELANDASDEQITQSLDALGVKLKGLAEAEKQKTELTNARDTSAKEFTNERTGHIGTTLDLAIAQGRIGPAQREEWKTKLEADFGNAKEELMKLKVLKTEPTVTAPRVEASNAVEKTGLARASEAIAKALKK